ncbi:MAG TPA: lasso RiPP family leader peptide-containing protein [Gaiellaceae bacterium]|nr:lasso RiPP family leader peptide-containing protein [Gaiellaceae bacterium]
MRDTEVEQKDAQPYEPPALVVLGPAEDLTKGTFGGGHGDGVFAHHTSG